MTKRAPVHNTITMALNAVKTIRPDNSAPTERRRRAAWKESSTASLKRRLCNDSMVNAWTMCIAFSTSPAIPLESATRSWVSRDSLLTFLPYIQTGSTTTGNKPNSSMLSRELVTNNMIRPPARINELRKAMETPAPDHGLNQGRIGGQPGEDFAGLGNFEECRVHFNDVFVNGGADIRDHPFSDPHHRVIA